MLTLRNTAVLSTFAVTTYLFLNWLLDLSWNWVLIGRITIGVFATIAAILIGAITAQLLLTVIRRVGIRTNVSDY